MQFRRGPTYADRAWQPCPGCGVPDVVMRDQDTKWPISPPPLVPTDSECLMCGPLAAHSEYLAEQFDPENKRLPPGVRVFPGPYVPEDDEEEDDG